MDVIISYAPATISRNFVLDFVEKGVLGLMGIKKEIEKYKIKSFTEVVWVAITPKRPSLATFSAPRPLRNF